MVWNILMHHHNIQNSTQTNTQSEIESNSIPNINIDIANICPSNSHSSIRSYCSCKKSGTYFCKSKCECAKLSLPCIPDHCSCGGPKSKCCSPIISDINIQRSHRQAKQNITYINENIETNSQNQNIQTHIQDQHIHKNKTQIEYEDDRMIIKNCSDLFINSNDDNQLFKTSQGFIKQYKMRMKQTNQLHAQQIQSKDQQIEQLNLQIKNMTKKIDTLQQQIQLQGINTNINTNTDTNISSNNININSQAHVHVQPISTLTTSPAAGPSPMIFNVRPRNKTYSESVQSTLTPTVTCTQQSNINPQNTSISLHCPINISSPYAYASSICSQSTIYSRTEAKKLNKLYTCGLQIQGWKTDYGKHRSLDNLKFHMQRLQIMNQQLIQQCKYSTMIVNEKRLPVILFLNTIDMDVVKNKYDILIKKYGSHARVKVHKIYFDHTNTQIDIDRDVQMENTNENENVNVVTNSTLTSNCNDTSTQPISTLSNINSITCTSRSENNIIPIAINMPITNTNTNTNSNSSTNTDLDLDFMNNIKNINTNSISTFKPNEIFELLNNIQIFLKQININNIINSTTINSNVDTSLHIPSTQITIQT